MLDGWAMSGGRGRLVVEQRPFWFADEPRYRSCAEALLDAGLPVEVVGLGGLLTTPEVADVVATLRVLADHRSGPALARLLTGARWRIGASDLAALSRRARRLAEGERPLPPETPPAAGFSASPAEFPASDAVDQGSLVEALDDLGPATDYSPDGHRRLAALSAEMRGLRQRLGGPLPELVAEVEHVTGVGVEVAARADRARVGRAHLDRFLDEAARFAADADEATLGAFLAFVDAAEVEENGLEAGETVVAAERIQVLTVHGAKGLEWDLVAVPGLVETVFPAEPRAVDWTRTRHLLPTPLRGDRADLPALDVTAADRAQFADHLDQHTTLVRERHRTEERRLAYVAVTRARSMLLASGYAWDSAKAPRRPSAFLVEIRDLAEVGRMVRTAGRCGQPAPDPPRGRRYGPLTPSAIGVRTWKPARSWFEQPCGRVREPPRRPPGGRRSCLVWWPIGRIGRPGGAVTWTCCSLSTPRCRRRRASMSCYRPNCPCRSSSPSAATLTGWPRRLRRPLPAKPAPLARRGTAFHAWLERRWSAQALLDVDELPGAARRERRRCRLRRVTARLRGESVGGADAVRGRGAVRHDHRTGHGAGANGRGVCRCRRRLDRGRLEDRHPAHRRRRRRGGSAARRLPARLGSFAGHRGRARG